MNISLYHLRFRSRDEYKCRIDKIKDGDLIFFFSCIDYKMPMNHQSEIMYAYYENYSTLQIQPLKMNMNPPYHPKLPLLLVYYFAGWINKCNKEERTKKIVFTPLLYSVDR
jgi:hypothetical protein